MCAHEAVTKVTEYDANDIPRQSSINIYTPSAQEFLRKVICTDLTKDHTLLFEGFAKVQCFYRLFKSLQDGGLSLLI